MNSDDVLTFQLKYLLLVEFDLEDPLAKESSFVMWQQDDERKKPFATIANILCIFLFVKAAESVLLAICRLNNFVDLRLCRPQIDLAVLTRGKQHAAIV